MLDLKAKEIDVICAGDFNCNIGQRHSVINTNARKEAMWQLIDTCGLEVANHQKYASGEKTCATLRKDGTYYLIL